MFTIIYITAGSVAEAQKIAHALVSNNLAACVNMHPISSVYIWDGKVEDDSEIAMFVKTTSDKFDEINDMVHSIHSYDLPCVISWEIKGDEDYLRWVSGCVGIVDGFEPKRDLVKIDLCRDGDEAMRGLVHDQAANKINHYAKKISQMEKKYTMNFSEFEKVIHAKTGNEDFEEWDDFILWESYVKAHQYWEKLA